MTDRIVIFYGSKKDFEELVATETSKEQVTIPFMELIQHYNARLRPNESGVRESALSRNIDVDNCVVRADDYGSVLEHVLSNFVNVVTLNHDIGTLFVHNPPRKVRDSLRSAYGDDIEYLGTQYPDLSREKLKEVYSNIEKDILGQSNCKKQIISGMYRLIAKANNKPVVLMLYGPSGVGKTESAKSISKTMGGELLRIQFSMMQTTEAYNYVFGAEHSKGSFARDMMARESNVILIDEFDKVNPAFYNAFYELFDEGRYVDTNYDVNLGQAIFLLTCNFGSEEEIKSIGVLNPFKNWGAVFTSFGIVTTLVIILIICLITKKGYIWFSGYKYTHDPRGFDILPDGTHGTSGFLTEKEMREFLELSPAGKTEGMILGKVKKHPDDPDAYALYAAHRMVAGDNNICALNVVIALLKNKLLFRIYFFQNSCPSHP